MTFPIQPAPAVENTGEFACGAGFERRVRRGKVSLLLWALLLSAAAHVMLLSKLELQSRQPTLNRESYRLSLRLRQPAPAVPGRLPSESPSVEPVAGSASPPRSPAVARSRDAPSPAAAGNPAEPPQVLSDLPRALDLSLPPSSEAYEGSAAPRGTVFDGRLRDQLSALRRRRSASGIAAPAVDERAVDLDGGRVSRFYKVGNDCFRVLEADPLDAFGVDQWYMERCP